MRATAAYFALGLSAGSLVGAWVVGFTTGIEAKHALPMVVGGGLAHLWEYAYIIGVIGALFSTITVSSPVTEPPRERPVSPSCLL